MIIGLSGYARSGKDEAAKVLVDTFGFKRISFADKLRDVLYALNPMVDAKFYLKDIIDEFGWNGYKETPFGTEVRRLLQRLGTEAGRQTLWDSIWVDAAFVDVTSDDDVVVTDCRFPNEAEAVRNRHGKLWRIVRVGVGPANQHASETSLDDYEFDAVINNNSSLEAFRRNVANMYRYTKDGAQ